MAALPRFGRGKGWVWSPADGVLEPLAFPRIRTFDSSQTPRLPERTTTSGPLAAVDLGALTAALTQLGASTAEEQTGPMLTGREEVRELERRLRQHERELAVARARVAELEAAAAGDC